MITKKGKNVKKQKESRKCHEKSFESESDGEHKRKKQSIKLETDDSETEKLVKNKKKIGPKEKSEESGP